MSVLLAINIISLIIFAWVFNYWSHYFVHIFHKCIWITKCHISYISFWNSSKSSLIIIFVVICRTVINKMSWLFTAITNISFVWNFILLKRLIMLSTSSTHTRLISTSTSTSCIVLIHTKLLVCSTAHFQYFNYNKL